MSNFETLLGILTNISFYYAIFRVTAPILFATIGCSIAEKSNSTNMGMEGIMLISAWTAVMVSAKIGIPLFGELWGPFVGLFAAVVAGTVMGLLVAFFALKMKVDIILVGIATNLIGAGATTFFMYVITGDRSTTTSLQSGTLPQLSIPFIRDIPVIGQIVSGQNILTYFSWVVVFVIAFLLYKTKLGLRIRAVGENPDAASSVGISVNKTKTIALAISGCIGGFGGAFMSLVYLSYFSSGITAGRGFIALAACAMGDADPVSSALTALLFGIFYDLANYASSTNIPSQIVAMIPYLTTIIGLVVYSIRRTRLEKKRLRGEEMDEDVKELTAEAKK